MWRTILIYGGILAAAVLGLKLIEFQLLARTHPGELHIGLMAKGFMALGVWVGGSAPDAGGGVCRQRPGAGIAGHQRAGIRGA